MLGGVPLGRGVLLPNTEYRTPNTEYHCAAAQFALKRDWWITMSFYSAAYNIIGTTAAGITLPVWLPYVLLKRKYRLSLLRRSGFISKDVKKKLQRKPNIWVHAVSVGEFILAVTLIEKLKPLCPNHQFVVSVTTLTGYEVASKKLSDDDVLIFFPIELRPVMNKIINLVNPALAVIIETEIWPNFVYSLSKRGIPLVLANGRISEKSFSRYNRVKPFIKDVLQKFSHFNMQTDHDDERITGIGADKNKVSVTGNIKFDSAKITENPAADIEFLNELALKHDTPVFLAAALEKTGREDPIAINVFEKLREKNPEAALIIVPRHPERGADIAKLVSSRGFIPRQRSKKEKFDNPETQIFILDTVGELARLYTIAKIVYVGKSLLKPGGGQNMIEPVGLGLPVIYGKYTGNFRGIADVLASHGGAKIVTDENDLTNTVIDLWNDPEKAAQMVIKGQNYILSQQGTTHKNINTILSLLTQKTRNSPGAARKTQ